MATIEDFTGTAGVLTSPWTVWNSGTIAEKDGSGYCTANHNFITKSFLNSDAGWDGDYIKLNVAAAGTFTGTNLYAVARGSSSVQGYECRIAGDSTDITSVQFRKNGTFLTSKTISVDYATAGTFEAYFYAIDDGGSGADLYVEIVGATTDTLSYNDASSPITGGDSGGAIYNNGAGVGAILVDDAADYDATFGGGGGPTPIPPRLAKMGFQFATIIAHRLNGALE